jgi:hypothetical protein
MVIFPWPFLCQCSTIHWREPEGLPSIHFSVTDNRQMKYCSVEKAGILASRLAQGPVLTACNVAPFRRPAADACPQPAAGQHDIELERAPDASGAACDGPRAHGQRRLARRPGPAAGRAARVGVPERLCVFAHRRPRERQDPRPVGMWPVPARLVTARHHKVHPAQALRECRLFALFSAC